MHSEPTGAVDPRSSRHQPRTEGERLPPPGSEGSVTSALGDEPDHGEQSYRGRGRLEGRRALITGGDSGHRAGRRARLRPRGRRRARSSYLPEERATPRRPRGWSRRPAAAPSSCPATSEERDVSATWSRATVEELGGLDVLVNNAAYQMAQPGGIADITTEQFDRVMKTNLYAMFWLCKAALPHLHAGSSIINTPRSRPTSRRRELLDYATTKAGIVNFTQGLARHARREGHPGQHRRARPDLDAADPGDDAGGEGRALRRDRHRSGAPASRPRSRRRSCSSPRPRPATSPARSSRSPAASRCRRPSDPASRQGAQGPEAAVDGARRGRGRARYRRPGEQDALAQPPGADLDLVQPGHLHRGVGDDRAGRTLPGPHHNALGGDDHRHSHPVHGLSGSGRLTRPPDR